MMNKKIQEIYEGALKSVSLLQDESQSLWTVLRASLSHQLDYWLMLVHPSQIKKAAKKMDDILWYVLKSAAGSQIPRQDEGLGWDCPLDLPVDNLSGKSFQSWVVEIPIRMGGLGIREQLALSPIAYIGALEQTLPSFIGESGICPQLAHLVGSDSEDRWMSLVNSNSRLGREFVAAWSSLQVEAQQCCDYLGEELTGRRSPAITRRIEHWQEMNQ